MTDVERVIYEALQRTKEFGATYVADWTPVPPAPATPAQANTLKLYGDLNGVLTQLKDKGVDRIAASGAHHAGTTSKGVLRAAILTELHGWHDTAALIA